MSNNIMKGFITVRPYGHRDGIRRDHLKFGKGSRLPMNWAK